MSTERPCRVLGTSQLTRGSGQHEHGATVRGDGNVPADTGERPADTRLRALAAEANCFLDIALCCPGAFLDNSCLKLCYPGAFLDNSCLKLCYPGAFLDNSCLKLCYPGAFLDNSYLNVLFLKVDWEATTGRKRLGSTLLLPEVRTQGVRHPGTHQ